MIKHDLRIRIGIVLFFGFVSLGTAYAQSSFLQSLQNDTRSISKKILPSVVKVDVSSTVEVKNNQDFFFFFDNPFRNNPKEETPEKKYNQQGLGSGIIVRKGDGKTYYVLTNEHVVANADEVLITTYDNDQYPAKLVGVDAGRDLAVLSFESTEEIVIASLGDSSKLEPGDLVFAVGNPYGFQFTVTFGIISALNRDSRVGRGSGVLTDYIQTDAAVNRGNSGGPLININGEVIGINTWIYSEGRGGNEGLSFAIPINNILNSIDSVITRGKVDYGWLGVLIESVQYNQMKSLGQKEGAIVRGVYSNSPADKAGVKPGDIIYAVDGKEIKTQTELVNAISSLAPDKRVVVDIYRSLVPLSLSIRLGNREESEDVKAVLWPGFKVSDITESVSKRIQQSEGVIITHVDQGSFAYTAGFRPGDIIERINNTKVQDLKQFYSILNLVKKKEEVLFRLRRESTALTIGLERE